MLWFVVMHVFSTLLDWLRIGQLSEREKDLGFCQISERDPKAEPMEMDFTLYPSWLSHRPCRA